MSETYTQEFFTWALDRTRSSAEAIVPLVIERVQPQSLVDFGCGVGVWLEVFARRGVRDYVGVDGDWVPRDSLIFPQERFVAARLDEPLDLHRRFDLAVALEVAEHLPEHRANRFVTNLVAHAPCVLFSAAIPHQGGTDHVNEQWPEYWVALFAAHHYIVVDGLRRLVWSDPAVLPFYRQNVLVFATPEFVAAHPLLARDREHTADGQISLVHPDLLQSVAGRPEDHVRRPSARDLMLGELLAALPAVATRSLRWRLGRATRPTSRRRPRDSRP